MNYAANAFGLEVLLDGFHTTTYARLLTQRSLVSTG